MQFSNDIKIFKEGKNKRKRSRSKSNEKKRKASEKDSTLKSPSKHGSIYDSISIKQNTSITSNGSANKKKGILKGNTKINKESVYPN